MNKDGLSTLTLSEITLFAAPLIKKRHPRREVMRRYKVSIVVRRTISSESVSILFPHNRLSTRTQLSIRMENHFPR